MPETKKSTVLPPEIRNWRPPQIEINERVEFRRFEGDRPASGIVTRVGDRSCRVNVLTANGTVVKEPVFHEDDPILKARPEVLAEDGAGLYSLSTADRRAKEAIAKVDSFERLLDSHEEAIADLQAKIEKLSPQAKRGPGRPRKDED